MNVLSRWLKEKKTNTVFRNAGPGHTLSEPPPPAATVSPAAPSRTSTSAWSSGTRAAAAAEARAALAAVHGSVRPAFSSPSQQQQQQKQQQQQQRQQEQEQEQQQEKVQGREKKDEREEDEESVSFVCPVCDQCVAEAALPSHIFECVSGVVGPLEAAMEEILLHPHPAPRADCVALLTTYLTNVLADPANPKFATIRMANKAFATRLAPVPGAVSFLIAAGFQREERRVPVPTRANPHEKEEEEEEESILVLGPDFQLDELRRALSLLAQPSQIGPLKLVRSVRVFFPNDVVTSPEVPVSFYSWTTQELQAEAARRKEKMEQSRTLTLKSSSSSSSSSTSSSSSSSSSSFRFCRIRIKFASGHIVQATFAADETWGDLLSFTASCLNPVASSAPSFRLALPLGSSVSALDEPPPSSSATLAALHLVPTALLNCTTADVLSSQFLSSHHHHSPSRN